MNYDIFISYQQENKVFAEKLFNRLQNEKIYGRKLNVFFAEVDISPSKNLVFEIEEGLKKARYYVIILSPAYLNAEWPTAERSYAIYSDPSGRLGRIIPVVREQCDIPPLLAYRKYINMTNDRDFETGVKAILRVVRGPAGDKSELKEQPLQSFPIQLSFEPDEIKEKLFSNIYLAKIPEIIWSAPTEYTSPKEIFDAFEEMVAPAFILKEHRLFTFVDLSIKSHVFEGIIEEYDIKSENTETWLEDGDKRKWLIFLLNLSIDRNCRLLKMRRDPKSEKFYFPLGIIESVKWKPHIRTISKNFVITYKNKKTDVINFYAHRAIKPRFLLLGNNCFLRVETGFVFTRDGKYTFQKKGLATKFLIKQKNLQNFNENRFWMMLFSEDGKKISIKEGTQKIEINTIPASVELSKGIIDDQKEINFEKIVSSELYAEEDSPMTDMSELGGFLDEE